MIELFRSVIRKLSIAGWNSASTITENLTATDWRPSNVDSEARNVDIISVLPESSTHSIVKHPKFEPSSGGKSFLRKLLSNR